MAEDQIKDQDSADAERYRWLRDPASPVTVMVNHVDEGLAGEALDIAVDAAIGMADPAALAQHQQNSEDKARMDWIERKVCDVARLGDSARTLRISWNNGADSAFVGPNYCADWREAIDAAMQQDAARTQAHVVAQGAVAEVFETPSMLGFTLGLRWLSADRCPAGTKLCAALTQAQAEPVDIVGLIDKTEASLQQDVDTKGREFAWGVKAAFCALRADLRKQAEPAHKQAEPRDSDIEFELCVYRSGEASIEASVCGPRSYALREIARYRALYSKETECKIFEVTRRQVDFDTARTTTGGDRG